MKQLIHELINELDYRNEFTTKEIVLYSILTTVCLVIACCGESIVNMM